MTLREKLTCVVLLVIAGTLPLWLPWLIPAGG